MAVGTEGEGLPLPRKRNCKLLRCCK